MEKKKLSKKERHEKYMAFVIRKFFYRKTSDVFGEEYYTCKRCEATLYREEEAQEHYFKMHKKEDRLAKRAKD